MGESCRTRPMTIEVLKNSDMNGLKILTELYNKAVDENRIPKDQEVGIILPTFKKGDKTHCSNYRGITLFSICSKVYELMVEQCLKKVVERQLDQSQSEFGKGGRVHNHIFMVKLTEKANDE